LNHYNLPHTTHEPEEKEDVKRWRERRGKPKEAIEDETRDKARSPAYHVRPAAPEVTTHHHP